MAVTEEVNIFLSACEHMGLYGVNCVFCCRASIRCDICYVFISALELFKLYFKIFSCMLISLFYLQPPEAMPCACIWMGNTFPFFPFGFSGFRITQRHTKCFQPERTASNTQAPISSRTPTRA